MASEVGRLVVLVVWITRSFGANESEFGKEHPTMLVEKIRRQLMSENYDYMSSESEEMFSIKHELSNEDTTAYPPPPATGDRVNRTNDLDEDISENFISETNKNRSDDLDSNINDHFIPRANDILTNEDFEKDKSHPISKKDLLYYVDDDRLTHEAAENAVNQFSNDKTTKIEDTSPKVKYKVLKVKQPHPNRRSQTFRRFIQEEVDDGVAIINLDDESFPEFRLPRSRRQYMMDREDLDSEMEIAPLSDMEDSLRDT